jgi:CheY-like chemotaxis protein
MLKYLVDDDLEDQEIFDMALSDTKIKAELLCFDDAYTVMDNIKFSEGKPDFIFLDLNMPKINGHECLQLFVENRVTAMSKIRDRCITAASVFYFLGTKFLVEILAL